MPTASRSARSPRRHTDGWNTVRSDLGGAASLRQGVEKLHRMGRKITLYIEGLIVPTDSELFEHIPSAKQWIIHNPDGSNNGPYTKSSWYHMCPGSADWQDHVAGHGGSPGQGYRCRRHPPRLLFLLFLALL